MKVVWLCHFVNEEMREYFNTPLEQEMAPWVNNLINLFKPRVNIDLHIVAPNNYTNRDCFIKKDGVNYHFYALHSKLLPNLAYALLNKLFTDDYTLIQSNISKIIEEIHPDIIHLHGAENPYYSSGILPLIGKYPILLTIQGFARNSAEKSKKINKCIRVEEAIIKKINNIAVRTKEMSDTVRSLNPNSILHNHFYPVTIPQYQIKSESAYDIVYFARVSKDKGIEDLLRALALLKEVKEDISLHIIGAGSRFYKQYLLRLIHSLSIESNVIWAGFLKNQQDIFNYASTAKICVLPTYHDIIPGTIIESMFMKLPVVAYAVGGIPELNNREETIFLVEKQNIPQLAEKIELLLNNAELRKKLADAAYLHINERINNEKVVDDIERAYKSVLDAGII